MSYVNNFFSLNDKYFKTGTKIDVHTKGIDYFADRGQLVAADVVAEAGNQIEASEIRRRIKNELSAYKVPRHIFFAAKADLPFTDSGKIDKRRLGDQLADRIRTEGAGDA